MTLQNVRSLLWRGEDLGSVGGNTRELIIPSQVVASARPQIATLGFCGSTDVSGYFAAAFTAQPTGLCRVITNKSPDYWMTLTCMVANATGSAGVQIKVPIPPLQSFFVPANCYGPASLSANNVWPIPLPPSGAGSSTVPLATAANVLTADILVEQ